jgi:hypothetical protein
MSTGDLSTFYSLPPSLSSGVCSSPCRGHSHPLLILLLGIWFFLRLLKPWCFIGYYQYQFCNTVFGQVRFWDMGQYFYLLTFVILGIELSASHLLGWCSVLWSMYPSLLAFSDRVLCFFHGLALDWDPSTSISEVAGIAGVHTWQCFCILNSHVVTIIAYCV